MPIPRSGGGSPESARLKGNRAMQRKYRLLREDAYAEGRREFGRLALEPTFRDFVCLYIGEGYKRNRNCGALNTRTPVSSNSPSIGRLQAWMDCAQADWP
jgi:hypothetical protein